MRLRCTTEAWLYRLAVRENSAASMTQASARMTTRYATAATLSVPVFDAGNISPHLAPLFPARRPQASALERATHMDVRQQLSARRSLGEGGERGAP
jgi:hypothetical protein